MSDVLLKDEFGVDQTYEDINAVLLDTKGGGTATFISPDIIPAQVQADWEQTDETAVDFIKNKPDGLATQEWVNNEISKIDTSGGSGNIAAIIDILPEQELTFESDSGPEVPSTLLIYGSTGNRDDEFLQTLSVIKPGETYYVVINGVEYECVAQDMIDIMKQHGQFPPGNPEVYANAVLGNLNLFGGDVMTDTGEPFALEVLSAVVYHEDGSTTDMHVAIIGIIEENPATSIIKTVHIYKKAASSNLPEFTTEDEGKVLGIKDGVVNWVNVESSVTVKEEDILPEQEFIFTSNDGTPSNLLHYNEDDDKDSELLQTLSTIKAGETYYIVIDDKEYECVAQDAVEMVKQLISIPDDSKIYANASLGNVSLADDTGLFSDTGEPFLIQAISFIAYEEDGETIDMEMHRAYIIVSEEEPSESVTKSIRIYKKVEESNNYIKWDELCREENATTETDLFKKQRIDGFYSNSLYQGFYSAGRNFPESGYTDGLVDSFNIISGESYVVEWDGATYPVVGQDGSAVMPNTTILGDGSSFGIGESTGEPFVIGVEKNSGVMFASLTETIASHTIRIYTSTSSVETVIKSEFLPKHLQFGEKNTTISLIDTDVKFTYNVDNGWNHNQIPITSDIHLELGKTYTVEWNGTTYNCDSISVEGMFIGVGNPALIGGEDNGLPFAIAEDINGLVYGTPSFVMMTNEVNNIDTSITTELLCSVKIAYTGTVTKKIDTEYLYQTDWNEVDSSKGGYILNKPFGDMKAGTVISKGTVNCLTELRGQYAAPLPTISFIDGVLYSVTFDNVNYTIEAISDGGATALGITTGAGDIKFVFIDNYFGMSILAVPTQGEHTYTITYAEDAVQKIDKKYLPDDIGGSSLPDVTTSDNNKVMTVVNGEWTAQMPASGLPDATTSDNDKVLKVVNGSWTVANEKQELPTVTSSDVGKFLRVGTDGSWIVEAIQDVSEVGL